MTQVYGAGSTNSAMMNLSEQNLNLTGQQILPTDYLNDGSYVQYMNTLAFESNCNTSTSIDNATVSNIEKKNTENVGSGGNVDNLLAEETPIMTNEMKAVLAANFIASIQSSGNDDDSEDFD